MKNAEIELEKAKSMSCFNVIVNDDKEEFLRKAHNYLKQKYFE